MRTVVVIRIPCLPSVAFYLAFWSVRTYFNFVWMICRTTVKKMKVGNIFESLKKIFRSPITAQKAVKQNLDDHRLLAYDMYNKLRGA